MKNSTANTQLKARSSSRKFIKVFRSMTFLSSTHRRGCCYVRCMWWECHKTPNQVHHVQRVLHFDKATSTYEHKRRWLVTLQHGPNKLWVPWTSGVRSPLIVRECKCAVQVSRIFLTRKRKIWESSSSRDPTDPTKIRWTSSENQVLSQKN